MDDMVDQYARRGPSVRTPTGDGKPRIALAHDWLVGMRGGERVLDRLADLFGPTDLYTLVTDGSPHSPAIDACCVQSSIMQRWPGARGGLRRWYLPFYPVAVRSLRVEPRFDALVSTSSAMIKAIRPPRNLETGEFIPHLCYCHAPARYLWARRADYSGESIIGRMRTAGLGLFGPGLRRFDKRTCDTVTQFVANSTHTAREIERAYDREAKVIHPPVDTEFFTPDDSFERERAGGHYLVVSALEPYKRVDLAIRAANRRRFKLRIVGDGSHAKYLRSIAQSTVEFVGWASDERTRTEYRRARALLFPGIEDFGLVPVEAMACGCPVIAFNKGGAEDWMTLDVGVTFNEQSIRAMLAAIDEFEIDRTIDPKACRTNAKRFAVKRFDHEITTAIQEMLGRTSTPPSPPHPVTPSPPHSEAPSSDIAGLNQMLAEADAKARD